MARPLRVEFAGALYHLTARGARRSSIYEDDADRNAFLEILSSVVERYGWRCEAYCLMSNHYHLLVETPQPNLSRGMRQLNGVYAQRFNRRHEYVGPLFQGRFGSIVVDGDTYRLELARYIVLNPVRAEMVGQPGDWRWSSYGATIGQCPRPNWLAVGKLLAAFAPNMAAAERSYVRFVRDGRDLPGPWADLRHEVFLGNERFVSDAVMRSGMSLELCAEIPNRQRQVVAGTLSEYADSCADRNSAMKAAYATALFTLKEIADHFGVHYSTVSRIVNRGGGRMWQ
jgi:putative transposase